MTKNISINGAAGTRWWEAALILAGAVAVAGLVLVPVSGWVWLAACGACGLLVIFSEVLRGRIELLILCWVALYPFGSALSFPRERAIVSLDRVVIFLVFIAFMFAKPSTLSSVPQAFRRPGFACLAFIAVAAATLKESPDFLAAARYLVDSFLLPLMFAWCALSWFNVRRRLPALHTAVCVSSVCCAAIAAAEIVLGRDLLPIPGSQLDFAGAIPRPNGPFASNDQLALMGGESFFFLFFLYAAMRPNVSSSRKALHYIGLAAALGMALMPMFRSVMLTLVIVLVIECFWERRMSRRMWRVALAAGFVGLVLTVKAIAPDVFEDRSGAENVYGRVAEYQQTLKVFTDHPLQGVGFHNFNNFVAENFCYRMFYNGVGSLDWPHSNLSSALAETGLLGFAPYILMHLLLLTAMWQIRRSSRAGELAWRYSLYIILTYWITGLTESSGFEPLNVWYVFVIAVCYKYALTTPDYLLQRKEQTAEASAVMSSPAFSPAYSR